jgi:hypothetical protein
MAIMLICTQEVNNRTGRTEIIVSHGIDMNTDKAVVLPGETPQSMGAKYDNTIGEWILSE